MGVTLPDALVNVYSNKTCVQFGLLGHDMLEDG